MKISNIKKIIYIIPLVIGALVIYGAFSGKLQKHVNNAKLKIDEAVSDMNEDKNGNSTDETETIPEGKICLTDYFNDWENKPLVEEYDPDNKIGKNEVYGITKNESKYHEELYNKQTKITEATKIPSECVGSQMYNKEKILKWGSTFEINYTQMTCTYDNLAIRDDFKGLDSSYYMDGKSALLSLLDGNDKINNYSMYKCADDSEIKNPPCKLVTFDITIIPHSEWVTDCVAVPYMDFLKDEGKVLSNYLSSDRYYCKSGELNIVNEYPIYDSLGLYDVDTAGTEELIYNCSMRKGEDIHFTVGYIVPVELLDDAYLVFNPDCYSATDYSYATDDIAIFKIKE